jgi:hypothetical protein
MSAVSAAAWFETGFALLTMTNLYSLSSPDRMTVLPQRASS